jgi:hypothetical protein
VHAVVGLDRERCDSPSSISTTSRTVLASFAVAGLIKGALAFGAASRPVDLGGAGHTG